MVGRGGMTAGALRALPVCADVGSVAGSAGAVGFAVGAGAADPSAEVGRSELREASSSVRSGAAWLVPTSCGRFSASVMPPPATSTAASTRTAARRTGSRLRWETMCVPRPVASSSVGIASPSNSGHSYE